MKVLDLRCANGHSFEGWFASEEDFRSQCAELLLQCPLCGSAEVEKMLAAPRLNLKMYKTAESRTSSDGDKAKTSAVPASGEPVHLARAMYERMVQHVLSHTTDVGTAFAEQARKMHHGEIPEAAIRGKASAEEAQALHEEGIEVLALPVPEAAKNPLQ